MVNQITYELRIRISGRIPAAFFREMNKINAKDEGWIWVDGHYDYVQRGYNLVVNTRVDFNKNRKEIEVKDRIMDLCTRKGLLYSCTPVLR